jgi:hypothetical protein
MSGQLERINSTLAALRHAVVHHPLFKRIKEPAHVQLFMQHHVYAVWDFMSLLKTLQRQLTCVSVPWFPTGDADTRYLINEIVVGEESDVDMHGKRTSHFELYMEAMRQSGADTTGMEMFLATLRDSDDFDKAFEAAGTPLEARSFVNFTLGIVREAKPHVVAAVFSFGREDLIPDMFISLISDLERNFPERLSTFRYYLERHVEIDGGHHGTLAMKMVSTLCGDDEAKWKEATAAVEECLRKRMELWDAVLQATVLS